LIPTLSVPQTASDHIAGLSIRPVTATRSCSGVLPASIWTRNCELPIISSSTMTDPDHSYHQPGFSSINKETTAPWQMNGASEFAFVSARREPADKFQEIARRKQPRANTAHEKAQGRVGKPIQGGRESLNATAKAEFEKGYACSWRVQFFSALKPCNVIRMDFHEVKKLIACLRRRLYGLSIDSLCWIGLFRF